MPSEIVSPGTKMLRFLTPTEEWAQRTGKPISVPANWPYMLAEIFIAKDDAIWMTSTVGVARSWVKAFFAQGIFLYQFDELPEAIIEVLDPTLRPGRGRSQAQVGFAPTSIEAQAHPSEEVNRG
jgi:hypothetical protein